MTNTVTSNNIAAELRRAGVAPMVARTTAQSLDAQWYVPSQIRTAIRVRGLRADFIAATL